MQDLKKSKRKVTNKQSLPVANEQDFSNEEVMACEVTRSCRPKQNQSNDECECKRPSHHDCECERPSHHECECERPSHHECECKRPSHHECECNCDCGFNKKCEPCEIEAKTCFENPCGPACGSSISPEKFNVSNSMPFAIETNVIFDTMRFQTFTDGEEPDGDELEFETEVIEVRGPIPRGTNVEVTIERVCINYESIEINPGEVRLEDFDISPISDCCPSTNNCKTDFEYAVCGERDNKCCKQGKGKSVAYKQKGLNVEVKGLVLELFGRCGDCVEFQAIAVPKTCRVNFRFNTLAAPIVLPADGRSAVLRQNYQTSLTVDCIGKSLLCCDCCEHDGERFCELSIPNGIDLILCLQEIVSILLSEQIVVLGSPRKVSPRIVDTFSKVCDFSGCDPFDDEDNKKQDTHKRNKC